MDVARARIQYLASGNGGDGKWNLMGIFLNAPGRDDEGFNVAGVQLFRCLGVCRYLLGGCWC